MKNRMMKARMATRRPRRGFTLTELMIVVVLMGVIGSMLTALLVRQQRFHRAVSSMTDARARTRDVANILPTDLRSISTVGRDILAMDVNSMQFRAFIGSAILCRYAGAQLIELPPKVIADGKVLTAWINPPIVDDIVYLYDEGVEAGNADDSWTKYKITAVASAADATWCPSNNAIAYTQAADNGATRYRITLDAAPNQLRSQIGSPIRFAREVRYSIYQASDNQWYIGYQTCVPDATPNTAGTCGTREVLAGPVLPASTNANVSGLAFQYYNQTGGEVTDVALAGTIARIEVVIRTSSESLRRATSNITSITGGDSLRFSVGFRNRI
jgi:prepilin-type N-terminal cleavage/methylation domain-containing protein